MRTMKDGSIKKYSLAESIDILTITETSRANSPLCLKGIPSSQRQKIVNGLNAIDFNKNVRNIIKDFKDTRKDIDFYINKMLENKGEKYSDAILNEVKIHFKNSVCPTEEKQKRATECVDAIELVQSLRNEVIRLSSLREQASKCDNEEILNNYVDLWNDFMSRLDNIQKCEFALNELEKQFSEITDNDTQKLLKEEYLEIKEKWNVFNKELTEPRSMEFLFTVSNPQIQVGNALAIAEQQTIALQIPLPPKKPFRALWQKIQQFGSQLQEKVSEILNFFKKPTDDSDADSDSMNTHTPPKPVSPDLPKEKKDSKQTVFQQEETYSLAQKTKSYRVVFQENSGQNIQNCADYDMIIADKDIAEGIISNSIGRQTEREIPIEKEVKPMEENIYQEYDFSEPERKYDYEYDR